jgi:hypothetical protein
MKKRRPWATTFQIHTQTITVLPRISAKFWGGKILFCKSLREEQMGNKTDLIAKLLQ